MFFHSQVRKSNERIKVRKTDLQNRLVVDVDVPAGIFLARSGLSAQGRNPHQSRQHRLDTHTAARLRTMTLPILIR
jgi:hypothetical protein